MCWNAEVSLITFITSTLMCCYLWYRDEPNDRALTLWIFSFSLMQLFEFFMWINMKEHTIVAKLSLIFILIQPLVLAGGLIKYGNFYNSKWAKIFLWCVIAISGIKALYTAYYAFIVDAKNKWLSVKGPNCHLIWYYVKNENNMPFLTRINWLYYWPLFFICMLIQPFNIGIIYAIFGVITFYFSKYYYGYEYGSMWCWISNILAFFTIIGKYII
jgi:hypothetical protein